MPFSWSEWNGERPVTCSGTAAGYTSGCRCRDCTDAMTAARTELRRKARIAATPVRDASWRSRAACKGKPTEWWFASAFGAEHREAVAICATCPVAAACRKEAMDHAEVGLWGNAWRPPDLTTAAQARRHHKWKIVGPIESVDNHGISA